MKRRSICILLLVALLTATTGCSQTEQDTETQTSVQTDTETTLETDPLQAEYDALTVEDYGGYTFRIMNSPSNFAYSDVVVEELTGEALNDAVYNRNLAVCDALNIELTMTEGQWADGVNMARAFILANSDEFDIVCNEVSLISPLAVEGLLQDANTIDSLHLDGTWWDQNAIESANLGDHVYLMWGDMHLMLYECYNGIMFNKSMIENVGLDDLYPVVREGKWTFDLMSTYMESAWQDVNGDGSYKIGDDNFGLAFYDHGATCFFVAGGVTLFNKDSDNMPVFTGLTESYEAVFSKLGNTIISNLNNLARSGTDMSISTADDPVQASFTVGGTMFYEEPLGAIKKFRDVDFEVGLIPLPKYDETQAEYISYIYHGADAVTIPVTNAEAERTGVILEMFGAKSRQMVYSVYFDTTLDFKYIQDQESSEMMDIMFSNGVFDLGSIYNWGNATVTAYQQLLKHSTDIASKLQSLTSKTEADVQATIEAYLAH